MQRLFLFFILFFSLAFRSIAQNEVKETLSNKFEWTIYYFSFSNTGKLPPEIEEQYCELVDFINETDSLFVVEAHTDERGSDRYLLKLSSLRSYYFRSELKERLDDPNKVILSVGLGKGNPFIKDAKTEVEHSMNRRLVVRFATEEEVDTNARRLDD